MHPSDRRRLGDAVLKGDPALPPAELRSVIRRGQRLKVAWCLAPVPAMGFAALLVAATGGSYLQYILGTGTGMLCLAIAYVRKLDAALAVNRHALEATQQ